MVGKVNVLIVVTVLFIVEGLNGFSWSDLYSSEEVDNVDSDINSAIDDSDYWNLLSELSGSKVQRKSADDEKWNEIDNLEEGKWNEIDNLEDETWNEIDDLENEKWNEIDNLELNDDADAEIVEMKQETEYSEYHRTVKYHMGKRIKGDQVVAFSAKNQTFQGYRDVKSNMTYPAVGVIGKNLTYVEILVNQTSMFGRAYIVRGAIGKRFISIVVEASKTLYFNFKTTFYGL